MEKDLTESQRSVVRRAQSFAHAGRGLWLFVRTTPNAWIHIAVFMGAVLLGLYFSITPTEWMILILASAFVLAAEAFNTAIEIDIDLTSPSYHPHARDTKDVAAGAVLITTMAALAIGVFIFARYLV